MSNAKLIFLILLLIFFCGIVHAESGYAFTSTPGDVRVSLDNVYAGNTIDDEHPFFVPVTPVMKDRLWKSHTILYEKEGYESWTYICSQDNGCAGYGVYRINHEMRPLSKTTSLSKPTLIVPQKKGSIEFYSPLNNVNIFLNGNKIRDTNAEDHFQTNDLEAGTYLIEAKRQGYFDWSKSITVLVAQTTTVTIDLKVKKSGITINTIPSSLEVYIDDAVIGKTPLNTEIIQGVHKIKIQAPLAYESYEKTFGVVLEKQEINITLTPSAELLIPDAEKQIELNSRFTPVDAEYELKKAKNYFLNQDYVPALESAKNASKWAKDVDGDGVANEWDINPYVGNNYVYGIPFILIFIIGIVVLIDWHFCKVNPHLEVNIIEEPQGKRKFKLHISILLNKQIKSMSGSIFLDEKSIETLDAPGDYIIELGQLKRGTHEVSVDLSIIQKRYGIVKINKILVIDTDK